jgi:hypothetical protein
MIAKLSRIVLAEGRAELIAAEHAIDIEPEAGS